MAAANTTDARYKADILRRWSSLQTERSSWVAHWQEISDFLLPRSGRFFGSDRNRGTKRHNNIYDSTGTYALRILAAGMLAGMTSPARPWLRMGIDDLDLAKHGPVKEYLAAITTIILTVFQKSNTYRTLHTYYRELGAFGTSAGLLLPDFENVVHHHPLTAGEYAIATNWKGEAVTLYREFESTVGAMVKEFGADKCSSAVKRLYDMGNLDAWVRIVHAVEPREDRDSTKRDYSNMPWKSCYFELASDSQQPLREGGFNRFPGLVARWDLSGGDIYGNSPGMEALGDIKGLQHKQLRSAQVVDMRTNPPLQLPSSLKNKQAETLPGGITYYDQTTPGGGIRSLFEVSLSPQDMMEPIQDARQLINRAFSADLFLMLANATDTRMTATEVAERHEEKLLMLGPTIERLHDEMLNKLVQGTYRQLLMAGALPEAPQELHGRQLNVTYVSMLAQAQRAIATNGVDRYVSNLGAIAAFKPGILDKFDEDAWADRYADMMGVDPDLVVDNGQVAIIRNQRAQIAQQQAQAQQANLAADTAQKLAASPTTSDNALTALAGGVGKNLIRPAEPRAATAQFSGYN